MVWEALGAWEKIALYGFILLALFIYVLLSRLRFFGRTLVPVPYRIAIALLFPLLFVVFLLAGVFLLGILLILVVILLLLVLFGKRKIKIRRMSL